MRLVNGLVRFMEQGHAAVLPFLLRFGRVVGARMQPSSGLRHVRLSKCSAVPPYIRANGCSNTGSVGDANARTDDSADARSNCSSEHLDANSCALVCSICCTKHGITYAGADAISDGADTNSDEESNRRSLPRRLVIEFCMHSSSSIDSERLLVVRRSQRPHEWERRIVHCVLVQLCLCVASQRSSNSCADKDADAGGADIRPDWSADDADADWSRSMPCWLVVKLCMRPNRPRLCVLRRSQRPYKWQRRIVYSIFLQLRLYYASASANVCANGSPHTNKCAYGSAHTGGLNRCAD